MESALPVSVAIEESHISNTRDGPQEVVYQEVINFTRSTVKGQHNCVMCGKVENRDCVIPSQNKDVCKVCDSRIWFAAEKDVHFKFCKGNAVLNE